MGRVAGVAIGEGAHAKQFPIGDGVGGEGVSVTDRQLEMAKLYKVSKLKVLERSQ